MLCVFLMSACEQENNKGFYGDENRIYFAADSLDLTMGTMGPEVLTYTFEYPVAKMGFPVEKEMKYKVSLVADKTNAVAGVHYTEFPEEFTFPAGTMETVLPIEILRTNLNEANEDGKPMVYQLTFRLEPSNDFELGAEEHLTGTFTFNNFLAEPEWWAWYFPAYADYNPGMYARLIAYYGYPLDDDHIDDEHPMPEYLALMYVFKTEVYDYAQEHPELTSDWVFKENLWWPFE